MRIVSAHPNHNDPALRVITCRGDRPPSHADTTWIMLMAMDEQLAEHGLEIVTYRWNGTPHRYIWKIEPRSEQRA